MNSQEYSDSLLFLALRMIHRHPLSLNSKNNQGNTMLEFAESTQFNACREIVKVFRLTPTRISRTPFPTLLQQLLPKQYVDSSVFGT